MTILFLNLQMPDQTSGHTYKMGLSAWCFSFETYIATVVLKADIHPLKQNFKKCTLTKIGQALLTLESMI